MDKINNQGLNQLFNQTLQSNNNLRPDSKSSNSANRIDNNSNSRLSINSSARVATEIVFQSVNERFADSYTKNSPINAQASDKQSSFNVDDIVSNLIKFANKSVNDARSSGSSNKQLSGVFNQIQKGVNEGLEQALGELENLGLLTNEVKKDVKDIRSLFKEQLNELRDSFSPKQEIDKDYSSYSTKIGASSSFSYSESSSLELVTNDGDKIKIYLGQGGESNFALGSEGNGNGRSSSAAFSISSYQEFSFSVEGELSEEEKAAIGDLLNQVASVQESFFNNDIGQAFEKVKGLDVDFSQISSLSLDLQQTQSRSAQSYAEVADFGGDKPQIPSIKDEIDKLASFINDLTDLKSKAEEELNINKESFASLINSVLQKVFEPTGKEKEAFSEISEKVLDEK